MFTQKVGIEKEGVGGWATIKYPKIRGNHENFTHPFRCVRNIHSCTTALSCWRESCAFKLDLTNSNITYSAEVLFAEVGGNEVFESCKTVITRVSSLYDAKFWDLVSPPTQKCPPSPHRIVLCTYEFCHVADLFSCFLRPVFSSSTSLNEKIRYKEKHNCPEIKVLLTTSRR